LLQQVHSANGLLLKALSCARNTFLCSASLLFTTAQTMLVETKSLCTIDKWSGLLVKLTKKALNIIKRED
jgi:hypothetical protein